MIKAGCLDRIAHGLSRPSLMWQALRFFDGEHQEEKAPDLHAHVGKRVTTIGWMVTGKTVHTKDGEPMKFISFEDTSGLYETVFFPRAYNRFCPMLNEMRPYILKGKVEEDFGSINLTVSWIGFLDKYKRERCF